MNTDSVKKDGQIKEQIDMEYKARRNYPRKWSKFYNETSWNEMYNQNEISKQLKQQLQLQDSCPYRYNNEGDAYFVSPEMYKSQIANCRCGRLRCDIHLSKCVQGQQNKYLLNGVVEQHQEEQTNAKMMMKKLPNTSSGFLGRQSKQPNYKQWENSMKYISPIYDMPGEKITTTPYNVLIIG